tara:strand:+ start:32457 stop:32756 length:300 start_codon:yes stop_codon:yes gene_type:complete
MQAIVLSMMQTQKFKSEEKLHHKGLVPLVAYMIISGHLELIDRKGQVVHLNAGELVCLKETWNHVPFQYEIKTKPGTTLLPLDRSMLNRLREELKDPIA